MNVLRHITITIVTCEVSSDRYNRQVSHCAVWAYTDAYTGATLLRKTIRHTPTWQSPDQLLGYLSSPQFVFILFIFPCCLGMHLFAPTTFPILAVGSAIHTHLSLSLLLMIKYWFCSCAEQGKNVAVPKRQDKCYIDTYIFIL